MQRTVAGIVLAGALFAACGGATEDNKVIVTPGDAVREIGTTSARLVQREDNGDGPEFVNEMTGVFDFARRDGLLESKIRSDDVPMTMRIVDSVAYMRVDDEAKYWEDDMGPLYTPDDPCFGKSWGAIDPKSLPPDPTDSPNGFLPVSAVTGVVGELEGKGGTLHPRGEVEVRGTSAQEYEVDIAKLRVGRPFNDPEFGETLTAMRLAVDTDGRLVRLVYTTKYDGAAAWGLEPTAEAPLLSGDTTTTIELWDFGVPVDVKKPPAEATCDFLAQFGKTMDEFD